jgi:hypothetical protein
MVVGGSKDRRRHRTPRKVVREAVEAIADCRALTREAGGADMQGGCAAHDDSQQHSGADEDREKCEQEVSSE